MKLLATLNHPGIATVYGLHEADGRRFLAMELVPGEDLSHSPTLTAQTTAAGVILGTAAYMSPEQARGREVDRGIGGRSSGTVAVPKVREGSG